MALEVIFSSNSTLSIVLEKQIILGPNISMSLAEMETIIMDFLALYVDQPHSRKKTTKTRAPEEEFMFLWQQQTKA